MIKLKDGDEIPIEDIKVGDEIKTFSRFSKVSIISKLLNNLYRINFSDTTSLTTTQLHPLILEGGRYGSINPNLNGEGLKDVLQLKKLDIGDKLPDGRVIQSIERLDRREITYFIILEDDFSHYADGTLVLTSSRLIEYILGLLVDHHNYTGYLPQLPKLRKLMDDDLISLAKKVLITIETNYNVFSYNENSKSFKINQYYTQILDRLLSEEDTSFMKEIPNPELIGD
jgi:hypothetical protein